MRNDLIVIRDIRNGFAHIYATLSFSDRDIMDRCRSLYALGPYDIQPPKFTEHQKSRARFIGASVLIAYHLLAETKELRHFSPGRDIHFMKDLSRKVLRPGYF